jgi:hypothetical protein
MDAIAIFVDGGAECEERIVLVVVGPGLESSIGCWDEYEERDPRHLPGLQKASEGEARQSKSDKERGPLLEAIILSLTHPRV